MIRLPLLLAVMLCLLAQGCANLAPSGSDPVQSVAATERQLLVMVKEAAVQRYRPGSASLSNYRSGPARARTLHIAQDLAHDYELTLVSDWAMPALGVRCFLVEIAPDRPAGEVAARLAEDPRVESAQPQQLFQVVGHDDPYYSLQTGAQQLQLDVLHHMATGKAVKVAQIDTGVDSSHPDLAGQFSAERNFVDERRRAAEVHGTAVAGIIAAKADNGVGIVGVAPGARLLSLRACWEPADGSGALCSSFTLAKAMQFALVQRVQVINLSLTGPHDRLLERLIDSAARDGVTLVAALGPDAPGFPASHPAVIPVGASGSPSTYEGAVLAPGRDVLTTRPGASWGFFSGASFAAAHVSGLAALMLEHSSGLTPVALRALLTKNQAVSPGAEVPVLNACAALAQASHARDCACCGRAAVRPIRGRANAPAS